MERKVYYIGHYHRHPTRGAEHVPFEAEMAIFYYKDEIRILSSNKTAEELFALHKKEQEKLGFRLLLGPANVTKNELFARWTNEPRQTD